MMSRWVRGGGRISFLPHDCQVKIKMYYVRLKINGKFICSFKQQLLFTPAAGLVLDVINNIKYSKQR